MQAAQPRFGSSDGTPWEVDSLAGPLRRGQRRPLGKLCLLVCRPARLSPRHAHTRARDRSRPPGPGRGRRAARVAWRLLPGPAPLLPSLPLAAPAAPGRRRQRRREEKRLRQAVSPRAEAAGGPSGRRALPLNIRTRRPLAASPRDRRTGPAGSLGRGESGPGRSATGWPRGAFLGPASPSG